MTAKSMGYHPVGVSRNAGYTIGYHVVKAYLKTLDSQLQKPHCYQLKTLLTNQVAFHKVSGNG